MPRALILLALLALSACNTIEGMGRDIQAAGHAVTGGAEEGRERINSR
jgi:entericidin B